MQRSWRFRNLRLLEPYRRLLDCARKARERVLGSYVNREQPTSTTGNSRPPGQRTRAPRKAAMEGSDNASGAAIHEQYASRSLVHAPENIAPPRYPRHPAPLSRLDRHQFRTRRTGKQECPPHFPPSTSIGAVYPIEYIHFDPKDLAAKSETRFTSSGLDSYYFYATPPSSRPTSRSCPTARR